MLEVYILLQLAASWFLFLYFFPFFLFFCCLLVDRLPKTFAVSVIFLSKTAVFSFASFLLCVYHHCSLNSPLQELLFFRFFLLFWIAHLKYILFFSSFTFWKSYVKSVPLHVVSESFVPEHCCSRSSTLPCLVFSRSSYFVTSNRCLCIIIVILYLIVMKFQGGCRSMGAFAIDGSGHICC
jgi:hypothetical protein